MMRFPIVLLTVFVLEQPAAAESLLDRLLRFTGISKTPGRVRADTPADLAGEIRISQIDARAADKTVTIARDRRYQWPIFSSDGRAVFALADGSLFRIPASPEESGGGRPEKLHLCPRVAQLVGLNKDAPYEILVRTKGGEIGILSVCSGAVALIQFDEAADKDTVEYVAGQVRDYDNGIRLKVSRPSIDDVWKIVIFRPGRKNIHVSSRRTNCSQPSLSPDGERVVYVASPWK